MLVVALSWPFVVAFSWSFILFHAIARAALGMLGPASAVTCAIFRHIHIVIPVILHEIHRTAACIVLAAVIAPFLCMSGRNMQINRLVGNAYRSHNDGFRVDQHRPWEIPDIDAPVEAWLADRNRYAYVGC